MSDFSDSADGPGGQGSFGDDLGKAGHGWAGPVGVGI